MGDAQSTFGRVLTWIFIGVIAVIALKIVFHVVGFVMGLLGIAFGIAMFVLFTLGPIVLLGWLVMKAWRAFAKEEPAL